ncbi:MAG: YceI family protein [Chitinophagales bacterium]|nr:YceI family protein [Chitinophagales bacterium]
MKSLIIIILSVFTIQLNAQDILMSPNANISFFSSTPIEDIAAKSDKAVAAINVKTKDVFFKVQMSSFVFKKSLMQEHFNENYIESEKYPTGTLKGKINEDVDLTKNGTYNVTVTGDFTIHGVTQNRIFPGTIVVSDGQLEITCAFDVKLADYKIEIPTVVLKNIAESVAVKVNGVLKPLPPK